MNEHIEWHYCDRVEPGEYRAYCRSAHTYRDGPYARWICALQFDILDPSLLNLVARLTYFLNLGSGERPRATSRRSKYWSAWVAANAGPPKRRERLSPNIFVHRHAVVLVGDVARNFKQMAIPVDEVYSVIRAILRWETG